MPFRIIRNDITKVHADVLVNTANPKPIVGGGTDTAIYEAAGREKMLKEREKIGNLAPGTAAITPAFNLPAEYVIHTVGPVWVDGEHGEFEVLKSCYRTSLQMAKDHGCESIAFPMISTGVYGFPKDKALQTAISVFSEWLLENEMTIILVVFDRKAFELSGKVFQDVDAFVDEHYVDKRHLEEYSVDFENETDEGFRRRRARWISKLLEEKTTQNRLSDIDVREEEPPFPATGRRKKPRLQRKWIEADASEEYSQSEAILYGTGAPPELKKPGGLEELIGRAGDTFQQRLLKLIDERKLTDAEVYNKANIDRKLFSKIRCNVNYHPKKKTVLALAIALKLNMEETKDLLERAEMALSPGSKADLIITWFIQNRRYDMFEINEALFKHHQPTLGV